MPRQITLTCDKCGKKIKNDEDHIVWSIHKIEEGKFESEERIYHLDHAPKV